MNDERFGGLGGRTHRGEVEDERHHGEESRDKSRLDTDYVDGKTVNDLKTGAIDRCLPLTANNFVNQVIRDCHPRLVISLERRAKEC